MRSKVDYEGHWLTAAAPPRWDVVASHDPRFATCLVPILPPRRASRPAHANQAS
jgi:hypothetical protein